ncbi:hypothetical protein SASPL_133382 [Salvia splendens]|uniref:Reverse transcriptase Ty1/copia-type domain-containing protein n=1 Tax=Salvia splendens TaxID=180675 RepID=A0A8X8X2X9_SALSN|nr:hypothetical protein SASPL_133382 [Salvia splendens]
MGLALLAQSGLPSKFWDDAFTSACFLINLTPSKPLQFISPFEKLFRAKPDYHLLRVFGYLSYPYTRPYNKHKLEFHSAASTFLSYNPSHKGYKALLPNGKSSFLEMSLSMNTHSLLCLLISLLINQSLIHQLETFYYLCLLLSLLLIQFQLFLSRQIILHYKIILISMITSLHLHLPSPHSPHTTSPVPSDTSSVSSQTPIQSTPSSVPAPATPSYPMITLAKAGIFRPKIYLNTTYSKSSIVVSLVLPKSATAALLIFVWKQAMEAEFLALLKNKIWTLTTLPPRKNLVGCTWIFKLKKHADGSVACRKAKLVAHGFSQQPGFDYTETFNLVVKPTTIRLILSIAVSSNWGITHLDVNNTFLHGDLQEEIYMHQPKVSSKVALIWFVAIYGIKQASRAWCLTVQGVLFFPRILSIQGSHFALLPGSR